ncbi:MAG: alpha/beta fold hydrolase [Pseudomonadota bacterium]
MTEPLVLIPGMMCDERLFQLQVAAFSSKRPVTVVVPKGSSSMAGLAQAVLATAPPRFALAGLSLGGIVAMQIIRQAPERVSRVALLDTNPLPDPPDKAPIREAQVEKVRRGALDEVMRDEMKPNYLADGPAKQDILDLCMQMANALGPEVFAMQSQAVQTRPDQSDTLRGVTVPALVLCGQEDRLCPVERHELMHDLIPESELVVIPCAGHLPTLEQPNRTNEALQAWLTH